jgi:hypothetical protein
MHVLLPFSFLWGFVFILLIFETNFPLTSGGIYVCLQHYVGLCANHVKDYSHFNGCKYFLHIQKFKIQPNEIEEPKDKVFFVCFLKSLQIFSNI